jgi:hypothetical protein
MIHHIEIEVDPKHMVEEVALWGALGWAKDYQRTRGTDWKGEWLRSLIPVDPFIWLIPTWVEDYGHRLTLEGNFESRLRALDRLDVRLEAVELEPYWGARRVEIWAPSSYTVVLLERAPAAHRYSPPGAEEER